MLYSQLYTKYLFALNAVQELSYKNYWVYLLMNFSYETFIYVVVIISLFSSKACEFYSFLCLWCFFLFIDIKLVGCHQSYIPSVMSFREFWRTIVQSFRRIVIGQRKKY